MCSQGSRRTCLLPAVLDELLEDRGAVIEGGAAESAISMG